MDRLFHKNGLLSPSRWNERSISLERLVHYGVNRLAPLVGEDNHAPLLLHLTRRQASFLE
jgi:hypothetical protein